MTADKFEKWLDRHFPLNKLDLKTGTHESQETIQNLRDAYNDACEDGKDDAMEPDPCEKSGVFDLDD